MMFPNPILKTVFYDVLIFQYSFRCQTQNHTYLITIKIKQLKFLQCYMIRVLNMELSSIFQYTTIICVIMWLLLICMFWALCRLSHHGESGYNVPVIPFIVVEENAGIPTRDFTFGAQALVNHMPSIRFTKETNEISILENNI